MLKIIISLLLFICLGEATYLRDESKNILLDTRTNLIWQDSIENKRDTKNWSDADSYCQNLDFANLSEWRVPNQKELISLVNTQRERPSISPVFVNVNGNQHDNITYWSSSSSKNEPSKAWYVNFDIGISAYFFKSELYYVRCVHSSD